MCNDLIIYVFLFNTDGRVNVSPTKQNGSRKSKSCYTQGKPTPGTPLRKLVHALGTRKADVRERREGGKIEKTVTGT